MKLGLYFRYSTRSLARGGNRTVLAGFCVGVGVMAIVGLQLAAAMVTDSLTANVRTANGGDISVVSVAVPFPASQLRTFQTLQREGAIKRFTAVRELSAILIQPAGQGLSAVVDAVDPNHFPLVGTLNLKPGSLGDLHQLLTRPDTMVLSGSVASLLKVGVGHRVKVDLPGARKPPVWTVGGILAEAPPRGSTTMSWSQPRSLTRWCQLLRRPRTAPSISPPRTPHERIRSPASCATRSPWPPSPR